MAEVGELTWVAEIQGLASAKRDAESVSDGVGDLANDARAADDALGGVGGTAKSAGGSMAGMGSASGLLRGALGLLNGTIVQLILNITGLGVILTKGAAIFGAIAGGITTLVSAVGGLSGIWAGLIVAGKAVMAVLAAVAAALGLPIWATVALIAAIIAIVAAIWVFRDEIWAAIKAVLGFFADLAADGIAFITDLASGIGSKVADLASSFVGAFTTMGSDAWDAVTGFASDVRDSISGLVSDVIGFGADLASGFTDAITNGVAGVWNTVIPSSVGFPSVELPSVTIDAGPLGSTRVGGQTVFSGFSFDLPQLETGGFVESGGAVEVHDDEMVLPADVSRDVMNALGRGDAGAGERVVVRIQQLMVDIGDQTLDLRELGRFELEQLAELIGEQMGNELQRLV